MASAYICDSCGEAFAGYSAIDLHLPLFIGTLTVPRNRSFCSACAPEALRREADRLEAKNPPGDIVEPCEESEENDV